MSPSREQGLRGPIQLLARTFAVDVLACPKCHGRMRLLAMVQGTHVPAPREWPEDLRPS